MSGQILDTASRVHAEIGPGSLESPYLAMLAHERRKRGLQAQVEHLVSLFCDGVLIAELRTTPTWSWKTG